ncbi:MAG: dienelactone hydrolase family protein [Cyclobacteriaceae bacterium]
MKCLIFLSMLVPCSQTFAQDNDLKKSELKTGNTSFYYYSSPVKSESVVILFHDWFGVSDLSLEMADRLQGAGMDVIIMDLYKGKSAKTNQEAGALMNSIDQANMWEYIDQVLSETGKKYDKIFIWGFSLGTLPASQTAIKNNELVDGLILFYGNVTQDREQIAKITFPALMVMGAKDNPAGAIGFFNNVNEASGTARLFIYPGARHAFAQKLFNGGANYDEQAKEASLEVAFRFLKDLTN